MFGESNPLEQGIKSGQNRSGTGSYGHLNGKDTGRGAGLAGFYTPTGVGTLLEKDKERRTFDGKEHIFERAIRADFAFARAYKADTLGNLVYRRVSRNSNPIMAMAADVTIAEVGEIVAPGAIDPDVVVTPGIFVDRLVRAPATEVTFRDRAGK